MSEGCLVGSFIVPVHPHTVLVPEQNEGWQRLRNAFDEQLNESKIQTQTFSSSTPPHGQASSAIKFKQIQTQNG